MIRVLLLSVEPEPERWYFTIVCAREQALPRQAGAKSLVIYPRIWERRCLCIIPAVR